MQKPDRDTLHTVERAKRISVLRHMLPRIVFWMLWTGAVVGTAVYQWYQDVGHQHPLNVVALVLHCFVVGVLGSILIEDIEFWLEED